MFIDVHATELLFINVHVSSPSAMSDHLSLPSAIKVAVGVANAAPNCTKPPFAVIAESVVDVAFPFNINCTFDVIDKTVLDDALPNAILCPALVTELSTVDVEAAKLTFEATAVVVTVELDVADPATVVKLSVTITVVLAANAPDVLTLTAFTFATPDVTDTVDAPTSQSAVEYLRLLNLY